MAGLQKQLVSQKRAFEEEAKAHEQLQEEHERELRHLKRDIKHKLVGLQPQRLLPDAQARQLELPCLLPDAQMKQEFAVMQHAKTGNKIYRSMLCCGGQTASLVRQQLRVMQHSSSREVSRSSCC